MSDRTTSIGNYEHQLMRMHEENGKLRELVKQAWTAMKHTRMACEDGVCDKLIVDAIAAIDAAFYPPNDRLDGQEGSEAE